MQRTPVYYASSIYAKERRECRHGDHLPYRYDYATFRWSENDMDGLTAVGFEFIFHTRRLWTSEIVGNIIRVADLFHQPSRLLGITSRPKFTHPYQQSKRYPVGLLSVRLGKARAKSCRQLTDRDTGTLSNVTHHRDPLHFVTWSRFLRWLSRGCAQESVPWQNHRLGCFKFPALGQALIQGQWEPRSECASDPSYVPRRPQHGNNIKASEPQDHKWPLTSA